MAGLFSSLNMSSSALKVHQAGISIVSNNISNMNTEGYHKQKLNLGTLTLDLPIGNNVMNQVKTSAGVEAISVTRYTTTFIGSYYRDQLTDQAYLEQQKKAVTDLAEMFDELGGRGLDSALEGFYEALDNLNQYPSDMSARINFLEAAETLTSSMNSISNNLNNIKNLSVGDGSSPESLQQSELYTSVQSLNDYLQQLANINKQLSNSQTGTLENNNLLDRRDLILNEISKLAEFKTTIHDDGSVTLTLGGTKIVSGNKVLATFDVQTATKYDEYCQQNGIDNNNECNAVIRLVKENGSVIENVNNRFDTGKIGGIISSATPGDGVNVNSVLDNLDTLAQTIADVFNELQTRDGAFYIDNVDGNVQLSNEDLDQYVIFTTSDGSAEITAGNISINSLLTEGDGYNKIAAAYFEDYDPTAPDPLANIDLNAIGNANNIIAMINTKTDNTSAAFDAIGNIPLSDYYSGIISKVNAAVTSATNAADAQDAVVQSLDNKTAEQTSVDLNEELTDLVKFQTAYSASARVFTTCNTLLDTLVNLGL